MILAKTQEKEDNEETQEINDRWVKGILSRMNQERYT